MSLNNVLAAAILFVQSVPVAVGSYGGLSGHDSVWRGMSALFDQTLNVLLFYGLVNLCFPNSKFRLARMDVVHTDSARPDYKNTVVNYRAGWFDIGNLAARSGEFKVLRSNGGHMSPDALEANIRINRDEVVPLAPNSNHWIYPYMLGKRPREASGMVVISRRSCIQTAALSVSRFAILLASSLLVAIFHILIIGILFDDVLVKSVLILADIGRWILVVGQSSSVFTYSLDYKGICSWASPEEYLKDDAYGTIWTDAEQEYCRREVLRYIGKMYHARAVFCLLHSLWPRVVPRIRILHEILGDDHITLLLLNVRSRGDGDLCNDFLDDYSIQFKLPTTMVKYSFTSRLVANPEQKKWNFVVLAPLCVCSIAGPFLLLWRDGSTSHPAVTLVVSVIFQLVALVFTYKDIDDRSINCKFEAAALLPQEKIVPQMQDITGMSTSHSYPPVPTNSNIHAVASSSTSHASTSSAATRIRIPTSEQDVTEAQGTSS